MKTNIMHCLSSVYFVNQPVHISGVCVAHYPSQPGQQIKLKKHNTYQLLYIYIYTVYLLLMGYKYA